MNDRAMLPRGEREALRVAMAEIVATEGSQTSAARKLGISQQAVGKAVNGADIGPVVARKIAEYFGKSVEAVAALYAQTTHLPARTVARDERYPSRADAARFAREAGLDEQAIGAVLAERLDADTDPGAMWWLDEMRRKHAELNDPFRRRKGRPVGDDEL